MIGKFKNREDFLQDELKRSSQGNANKLELIEKLKKENEGLKVLLKKLEANEEVCAKFRNDLGQENTRLKEQVSNLSNSIYDFYNQVDGLKQELYESKYCQQDVGKFGVETDPDKPCIAPGIYYSKLRVDEQGTLVTDGLKKEDVVRICREEINKAQVEQLGNNPDHKDWWNFGMFRIRAGEDK